MKNIKVLKLQDCEKGDIVQFLRHGFKEVKSGNFLSLKEYNDLKKDCTNGIVISKTKTSIKVLEFHSLDGNRFDGLLISSNIKSKKFLVCRLNYKLNLMPQITI